MTDIFDVIADPTRRALLQLLRDRLGAAQAQLGVGEFVEATGVPRQSVNRHLAVLLGAGLVTIVDDGPDRTYALDTAPLGALEEWLGQFVGLESGAQVAPSTAFSAWSGADAGETIGRAIAQPVYRARAAIEETAEKVRDRVRRR